MILGDKLIEEMSEWCAINRLLLIKDTTEIPNICKRNQHIHSIANTVFIYYFRLSEYTC